MSFLKKLAGDAMLYGMSSIVGRMLNYLLVFVHTRVFLQPELLTENAQLYTYVIPLNIIFTFGMETAFFRFASKKENRSEYFNIILSFVLGLSMLLASILIFFSGNISNAINFPGRGRLVTLICIIIAVDAVCAIAFVKLRAQNNAKKFVTIKIASICINVFFNLFYLVFCNNILKGQYLPALKPLAEILYNPANGADYIIWANYLASLFTLLMLWKEFVGFKFVWNLDKLKPVIKYAYPLMILGLAGSINLTADRLMFRHMLPYGFYPNFKHPDQAFSIYAQVYKLSIFMTLVVQAYRYAADPLFFAKMGDKNSPFLIALSTKWFTIASIVLWITVSLNLDWIGLYIGANYRSGIFIVPLLLLANLFIGVYGNISIWYKLSDKTQYGTYITIVGMAITIILNYLLIPVLGYYGCALTFCLSSILMTAGCYYYGQKNFPVPYQILPIILYILGAGLVIYCNSQIHISNLMISIPFHLCLILLFCGVIYVSEFKIQKTSLK